MKTLVIIIVTLFLATSTFAAELSEAGVKAFFADWLAAQNTGSYSEYAEMYSNNFAGIRRSGANTHQLNHDAWLKDRRHMFNKKMVVNAGNISIKLAGTTASVTFDQRWESGGYKDIGKKQIVLFYKNGIFKIVKEEMISSTILQQDNDNKVNQKQKISSTSSSNYSSILSKNCKSIEFQDVLMFTGADSAFECKGENGWRLFKVYDGDERSWLNLSNDSGMWSTADQVRINQRYFFGYFPNIDYSRQVEWRLDREGKLVALIFRVAVTDPNPNPNHSKKDSWLTKLYVIGLTGNEPFFCGTATTNGEARALADKAVGCNEPLLKETGIIKRYR